jgi:hypothetical protein
MRVAEENQRVVYLMTDAELEALFRFCERDDLPDHPKMWISHFDRNAGPKPNPKELKHLKYVDVTWPNERRNRYYRQDHPSSAEVLRISQPLSLNEEPKWLQKHLKR